MIHGSRVVITICQELQDTVVASGAGDRAILIENVMGGDVDAAASVPVREQWEHLRARHPSCSTRGRSRRIRGWSCCMVRRPA